MNIIYLDKNTPFPSAETALTMPNGLLAAGGDLSPERLLEAYKNGIFPWYNEGDPILWWSPDPRAVIFPNKLRISRSLNKTLRKNNFVLKMDHDFPQTIMQCARLRKKTGTWINDDMINAYITLHKLGIAHSFEVWRNNQLVGGLYGLHIGNIFCGESMFSLMRDASKIALVYLCEFAKEHGIELIDCQIPNSHLTSLGATQISREQFLTILKIGLHANNTTAPENPIADFSHLDFYITPDHPCSYLPDKLSKALFTDPNITMNNELYGRLTRGGFRRSGEHVYRPLCDTCNACIPIRLPVALFTPNKQQKRIWRKNSDVVVNKIEGAPTQEHYALYEKYIAIRHRDGDMYPPSEDQFHSYLFNSWSNTPCFEFRKTLDNSLLAVAVADQIEYGLSAVYTFFDPLEEKRSPGVYAVLWEIEHAKSLGLPYLYLGYWIKQCRKMRYKGNYRPLEVFINDQWLTLL